MATQKTRNNNTWTEARFNSFVKGGLRSISQRWPPRYSCLAAACVGSRINPRSGRIAKFYRCNACSGEYVAKDVEVNHIVPVVPTSGFDSWDGVVERLFCEQSGLEVVCKPCHKAITKTENESRKLNVE